MKRELFVVGRVWLPDVCSYGYSLTLGAEVAIRAFDPKRKSRITKKGVQDFLARNKSTVDDFSEVHAWRCQVGRAVVCWAKDAKSGKLLTRALNAREG